MVDPTLSLHRSHPRQYEQNKFVYPVVSRRSKGISIGVNLNPDKICNFDCIYCQVDRRSEAEVRFVELDRLVGEVGATLDLVTSGMLFTAAPFETLPPPLRRLNDIAFSGDGEPTTFRNFEEILSRVIEVKQGRGLNDVKLVLITNASMFHRASVQRGLRLLDENQGEIWAKLDAGTSSYFQLIDRTRIPFQRILDNITSAALERPLIIQSLFMRVHDVPPDDSEIAAYVQRLQEIQEAGGRLKLVQVYTVARQPAESFVSPLHNQEVDAIADRIRQSTGIAAETYYG